MTVSGERVLDEGRAALGRLDWIAAREHFSTAIEERESPEALFGLAQALDGLADYSGAIEYFERAFAAFRARGETALPALIAARCLSFLYVAVEGNVAACSGWLERSRSLAEESGECLERGWVELSFAMMTDDPDEKQPHIDAAAGIARRFDDADLAFDVLSYQGQCLIERGEIPEGMRRLDAAAAAATSGEVKDHGAIGEIFCKLLLCCEQANDVRRAEQWMDVAEQVARRSNYVWVSAICRMYYGGILTAAGRWSEAECTLLDSIRDYESGFRALRSGALVRLADLRLRQGRIGEAAELLAGYESDSFAVRPLAGLHLARGENELAATIARRFLDESGEHVLQGPLFDLAVRAEIAAGRVEQARAFSDRFNTVAGRSGLPYVKGFAERATGFVLRSSDEVSALPHLEAALSAFAAAGLPWEHAQTRLAIAKVLAKTQPAVAQAEAAAALEVFERLPAALDADEAAGVLRGLGRSSRSAPRTRAALTNRESVVLRLVAEGLSNEQIASRLYLSKRTVEHHISSIFSKLGISSRAEAVAYGIRHYAATEPGGR